MPAPGALPVLDVLNKPQRAKSDRYRRQTGIRTFLINGETLLLLPIPPNVLSVTRVSVELLRLLGRVQGLRLRKVELIVAVQSERLPGVLSSQLSNEGIFRLLIDDSRTIAHVNDSTALCGGLLLLRGSLG
jgi:hypothetical protein